MASSSSNPPKSSSTSAGDTSRTNSNKLENKEKSHGTESDTNQNQRDREDLRLWIGNLDSKLTETIFIIALLFLNYGFQLLKLVQRFGPIDNFDFLFHRTGPNAGLPRGYAFVTFKTRDGAESCLQGLNGKKIIERYIAVRWAHQTSFVFTDEEERLRKKLPALGMKIEPETPVSKERTINAIEAKLRAMERDKNDQNNFSLTNVVTKKGAIPSTSLTVPSYPYASKSTNQQSYSHDAKFRSKPYSRQLTNNKRRF